ncbi:MAG: Do family serine endopeptidase [Bacteroidales bacterium]|nr:Do family serine endopeptidase [Bacteroidales bacterium]
MEIKKYLLASAASLACAAFGAYLYSRHVAAQSVATPVAIPTQTVINAPSAPTDFTAAAELTVNGVVHIKVSQQTYGQQYGGSSDLFDFFFGPGFGRQQQRPQQTQGSGSGVIISADGYIVTNNHVINGADKIEVVLNDKRSFAATLVGSDPTTDIALVKIEADGLQPLTFGNSDNVRIGEWVLAVGNPFNLTSTVTAGIVSAKGRHVGINTSNMAIESFIQTDAAVNPGNSGGALVNTRGEVIGINTAIASPTGSFSGYSFAVPANIAQKVAQDLMTYGEVQRALLGVTIREVDAQVAEELDLKRPEGVLVASVADGGAAKEAGVKENDVIVKIDDEAVNSVPDLQSRVAQHRPGDSMKLTVVRDGKEQNIVATLRNMRGTTGIVKDADSEMLGAKLTPITAADGSKLGLRFGLRIEDLGDGKLKEAGVRKGFIITKANRVPLTSVKDFQQVVASASDGLFLAGVYPNGQVRYFAIDLQ